MRYGVFHKQMFLCVVVPAVCTGCVVSDTGLGPYVLGVNSGGAFGADTKNPSAAGGPIGYGLGGSGISAGGGASGARPTSAGGSPAIDGAVVTGGVFGTGGSIAYGMGGSGISAGGGAGGARLTSAGGSPAIDGAVAIGGVSGTGGADESGGTLAIGDIDAAAGIAAGSDAPATGGVTVTGGTTGTGGNISHGDVVAAGGDSGTGGRQGTDVGSSSDSGDTTGVNCQLLAAMGLQTDWCSCDQWGHTDKAGLTYYNDVWGSEPGHQCTWLTSKSWGTVANHPNTDGVKSYANVSVSPGTTIDSLKTYASRFDITVPTGGVWEATYDLTLKKDSTIVVVMLWMNYTNGKVFPKSTSSGPAVSDVAVGGHVWNVYYGTDGDHDVVSFLRTSNVSAGIVDIKAVLTWLVANKPSLNTTWTLDQVQFGFEIVSDGVPQRFTCNSFSIWSS